ncbi:hypothetical protein AX16_001906 [Volvariella volvacea WC 439]|nr:hypothetical protein AX16_001906 [Volvariella volvacea WC 439]
MAPTLRSAPSTPAGKGERIASSSRSPSITPRKIPRCSKCQRTRAGHPRSGCPYADSPIRDGTDLSPAPHGDDNITNALESLIITSATESEKASASRRSLRRTSQRSLVDAPVDAPVLASDSVLSLSTNTQELVDKIMQTDGVVAEDERQSGDTLKKKVVRWQDAIQKPRKSILKNGLNYRPLMRQLMPGTLMTPTPEGSFAFQSPSEIDRKPEIPQPCAAESSASTPHSPSSPNESTTPQSADCTRTPVRTGPQPLTRSMSMEQREAFMHTLDRSSTAMVYVLPKADIPIITTSATQLGYYTRVALNPDDVNDPNGLLVIGRGEEAVIRLFEQVANRAGVGSGTPSSPKPTHGTSISGGSAFRAVAGGAVIGAVGAFIGLAIS